MLPNSHFTAALVTFTEETLNGRLHFLCIDRTSCRKTDMIVAP